jgi:hypothetical protein
MPTGRTRYAAPVYSSLFDSNGLTAAFIVVIALVAEPN